MSLRSLHDGDDRWPYGTDPSIAARLCQDAVKVTTTLAGAAPGMYVLFTTPNAAPVLYAGPVVGMCVVYGFWRVLAAAGGSHGASHAEIVRKE